MLESKVPTVWKNEKFTLTEKIFREIDSLVTSFVNMLLSRNFCSKTVRVNSRNFQTVIYRASGRSGFQLNLSDVFFSNFFRQNCHHKWLHQHTVWKRQKFTLTLIQQNFRESNALTKVVTIELLSRNIFSVRVNFSFFHTVQYSISPNFYTVSHKKLFKAWYSSFFRFLLDDSERPHFSSISLKNRRVVKFGAFCHHNWSIRLSLIYTHCCQFLQYQHTVEFLSRLFS